jgi:hypothetical protein
MYKSGGTPPPPRGLNEKKLGVFRKKIVELVLLNLKKKQNIFKIK